MGKKNKFGISLIDTDSAKMDDAEDFIAALNRSFDAGVPMDVELNESSSSKSIAEDDNLLARLMGGKEPEMTAPVVKEEPKKDKPIINTPVPQKPAMNSQVQKIDENTSVIDLRRPAQKPEEKKVEPTPVDTKNLQIGFKQPVKKDDPIIYRPFRIDITKNNIVRIMDGVKICCIDMATLDEDTTKFPEDIDLDEVIDFRISEILINFYPSAIFSKQEFIDTFKNIKELDNGNFRMYLDPTATHVLGYYYDSQSIKNWREIVKIAINENKIGNLLMMIYGNTMMPGFSCAYLPEDWYSTACTLQEYKNASEQYVKMIKKSSETVIEESLGGTFEEIQDRLDVVPFFWKDANIDNLIEGVAGVEYDDEEDDEDEEAQARIDAFKEGHGNMEDIEAKEEALLTKEESEDDDDEEEDEIESDPTQEVSLDIDDAEDMDDVTFDIGSNKKEESKPEDDSMVVRKLN